MVQETNYIYLTIILCMHYLGLQQESYVLSIDSEKASVEQKNDFVELNKVNNKANEWLVTVPNVAQKVTLIIEKTRLTDLEKQIKQVTEFEEIDFQRFSKSPDTIFSKKNEALMVLFQNKEGIKFKILRESPLKSVFMKFNKK